MFQLCYRTFAFNDHPIIQDKNRSETTRPARDELRFQGEYIGVDSYLDVFPVLGAECVKKKNDRKHYNYEFSSLEILT